jgi:adenylate kinase family enzyme
MKVIVLGNAGAGKSSFSKLMIEKHPAARLSMDEVAFSGSSARRPLQDSIEDVKHWMTGRSSWIIEGCYADIIESILMFCDELIFLNPGVETCVDHCRSRPWEPEKFSSRQEQDENLDNLIQWVRTYAERSDEYGLARHRALYDSFSGKKSEYTHPSLYATLDYRDFSIPSP